MARTPIAPAAVPPDTDVALLNAMLHVIVAEGLVDEAFVAAHTDGFEAN
jgi:anaerobic selenocysteine-containing dehydrogenase